MGLGEGSDVTDSKAKGDRFERKIAKMLGEAFDVSLRRTPISGGWAEDYPDAAGDIVCTDPSKDWPFCIECKNEENWRLESLFTDKHRWFDDWWKQTLEECPKDKVPVLIFTRNWCPTFVAVLFSTALEYSLLDGMTLLEISNVAVTVYEFNDWVMLEQTLQRMSHDV